MQKAKVAILGTGNLATDLMVKILRPASPFELVAFVAVDRHPEGLACAKRLGVPAISAGMDALIESLGFSDIQIIFDATTAADHIRHDSILKPHRKQIIDLTPAALGPMIVPAVNLDQHLGAANVNLVTCGGQTAIPIIAAVHRVAPVLYSEVVTSIAATAACMDLRSEIDASIHSTVRGIEVVGGARRGKAIIAINPAQPPIVMRATVYCLVAGEMDHALVVQSLDSMIAQIRQSVPGFELKRAAQFENLQSAGKPGPSGIDLALGGTKVTVHVQVVGAGHCLPSFAGNLDIMSVAALRTAERIVEWRATEAVGS